MTTRSGRTRQGVRGTHSAYTLADGDLPAARVSRTSRTRAKGGRSSYDPKAPPAALRGRLLPRLEQPVHSGIQWLVPSFPVKGRMPGSHTVADTAWTAEHDTDQAVLVLAHHRHAHLIGLRQVLSEGDRLVIGRGRSVLGEGVLDDPRVSSEHAVLGYRRGAVVVRDLDSRNGTKVNGQRISSRQLVEGDVLSIGSGVWVLCREPDERPVTGASPAGMVGISWALERVLEQVAQVGPRATTVLVLGEPGVGKELVARAVHECSGLQGPFLAVNCGAMSDQLLQSELFGHVRGAFSGAGKARHGLVAAAQGGTLFLDEIGDASASLQVSLLRLLENGEYRPVGSDRTERATVRVVAATNRLELGHEAGRLRDDLHGRLSQWIIEVPPLRERREDIPSLAVHLASTHAGRTLQLDHRLALALCLHGWPGNVRELASTIERLVVESPGLDKLRPTPALLQRLGLDGVPSVGADDPVSTAPRSRPPRGRRERPEPAQLESWLVGCRGNMKDLAAQLGVGRNTLYRWFAEAALDPQRIRREAGLD